VAGSSGHTSGGALNHPVMYLSLNQLGSLVLDIDGDRLDATFVNNTGAIQDYLTILKAPQGNQAPTVNAGVDQAVILPASASLDGTVSDDGLPPGSTLTTTWSQLSGPGTVTFANANAVDTTASFSAAGTYALRLTATDSARTTGCRIRRGRSPRPGARSADRGPSPLPTPRRRPRRPASRLTEPTCCN